MGDEQDRERVDPNPDQAPDEGDGPASTPFDNPFFLPVILWALTAWFAWDVITGAEAYQKYPAFNIGGLVILTPLALYFTWSAIKERREERERPND